MIYLKSDREIEIMRKAGSITANILNHLKDSVNAGMSTLDIDKIAEKKCKEFKVQPAFKGYHGFPGCICISVNEEVVHGIPNAKKIIKEGDIVSLDFGVIYDGYYGDSAISIGVGKITDPARDLIEITKKSLFAGIENAVEGNHLFDISHAVQQCVESKGYSVVREFVGHGIGKNLHEEPQVPNFGPKGKGIVLKKGMVLAIEPMINIGTHAIKVLKDGWTAVTQDGKLSAHFEHTIAITNDGPNILTLPD